MAYYVIDRFEGRVAVLVGDHGEALEVPRTDLPKGSREGTVLRLDAPGTPDWSRAVIDEAERARRLDQARETLRRLSESDPGGNVEL
ncbi:MAG TPA: DUF3006 domain-containing protein [Gemmatimonadales bacterium]|nr:DUF3006 domain-containing protein [Gemmatimonadales bacterium]